jgi:hypothetical protein
MLSQAAQIGGGAPGGGGSSGHTGGHSRRRAHGRGGRESRAGRTGNGGVWLQRAKGMAVGGTAAHCTPETPKATFGAAEAARRGEHEAVGRAWEMATKEQRESWASSGKEAAIKCRRTHGFELVHAYMCTNVQEAALSVLRLYFDFLVWAGHPTLL